jgi:hypothetical protein
MSGRSANPHNIVKYVYIIFIVCIVLRKYSNNGTYIYRLRNSLFIRNTCFDPKHFIYFNGRFLTLVSMCAVNMLAKLYLRIFSRPADDPFPVSDDIKYDSILKLKSWH